MISVRMLYILLKINVYEMKKNVGERTETLLLKNPCFFYLKTINTCKISLEKYLACTVLKILSLLKK